MTYTLAPERLVREARIAAGLSQRALARRAGTAQSVVSRIESGRTDPGSDVLDRLLRAAGFEARVVLSPLPVLESHMLDDVARILRLSPEQRLLEAAHVDRFVSGSRRV